MNELFGKLSDNLLVVIVLALVFIAVVVLAILLFRSRKSKAAENHHVRAELAALERENQFALAAARLPVEQSPEEVANRVAELIHDHLWMPVYRIYAGQGESESFKNILASGAVESSAVAASPLAEEIPAQTVVSYPEPQEQARAAFVSEGGETDGERVGVIPWHGAYGWHGLIVGKPKDTTIYEALEKNHDALTSLSEKLSVALESANSHKAPAADEASDTRLTDFLGAVSKSIVEETEFSEVVAATASLLHGNSAALWLADPNANVMKTLATVGLRSKGLLPLPLGQGLAGHIMTSKEPLALQDAASDSRCLFPNETRESGIGSYLGVPMLDDGQALGVLEVHTVEPKDWNDKDRDLLTAVAVVVGSIFKQQQTQANQLKAQSAFMGLSESLQRLRAPEDLLDAAVEVLGHALGASRVIAIDFDNPNRPVMVQFEYKTEGAATATGIPLPESLAEKLAQAVENGEPLAVTNSQADSLLGDELVQHLGIKSELLIPVRFEGKTHSLLAVHQSGAQRQWKAHEIEFADRVGRQLALSLANLATLGVASRVAESAQEAARKSGEATGRAQAIINALPESFIVLDKEGRLKYFNTTAQTRFNLKADEIGKLAQSIPAFETQEEGLWAKLITAKTMARYEAMLKHPHSLLQPLSQVVAGNGEEKSCLIISASPTRNEAGDTTGFLVLLTEEHFEGQSTQGQSLMTREAELERRMADLRAAELQSRLRLEKLNALEAEAGVEMGKKLDEALQKEREQRQQAEAEYHVNLEQMRLTNQLKSEFIVNTGNEISMQSQTITALAQMLERGSCGELTDQQRKAVRDILNWSQQMKNGLTNLIEYGSSRSR
jgi:GAF domain-containing protein